MSASVPANRGLDPNQRSLIIRAYLHYTGARTLDQQGLRGSDLYSQNFEALLSERRPLDLVLCFHDPEGKLAGWENAISMAVATYKTRLGRFQIIEEANVRFQSGRASTKF